MQNSRKKYLLEKGEKRIKIIDFNFIVGRMSIRVYVIHLTKEANVCKS